MAFLKVKIGCNYGIHARTACEICNLTQETNVKVKLTIGNRIATSDSIIAMILLEGKRGETVTLECEEENSAVILGQIADLLDGYLID